MPAEEPHFRGAKLPDAASCSILAMHRNIHSILSEGMYQAVLRLRVRHPYQHCTSTSLQFVPAINLVPTAIGSSSKPFPGSSISSPGALTQ